MSRPKALLLALFTIWPLLYLLIFIGTVFSLVFGQFAHPTVGTQIPLEIRVLFPLHFFTMFEIMVLLAIYITFLFKTDRVPQDKKTLWAVVLFCGNLFAMPVFWYLYLWKEPGPG